jgi:hypothetical protein
VAGISLRWITVAFASGFLAAVAADPLVLQRKHDSLHIAAPHFRFLQGRPLQRLKYGIAVPFDFSLTLSTGSRTVPPRRTYERFVLSYDLWEEKFSIVQTRGERRTATRLTAAEAEAWCLESVLVSTAGLSENDRVTARLEVRAAERDQPVFGAGSIHEGGISLNGLIEIFSRPPEQRQSAWVLETGPVRLGDIRYANGRGL